MIKREILRKRDHCPEKILRTERKEEVDQLTVNVTEMEATKGAENVMKNIKTKE